MYLFDMAMLSGLFEREKEQEILFSSIGNMQMAANALQWSLVNGLDSWLDRPLKLINAIHIGSYPKRYKLLNIPTYEWSHFTGAKDINVGFCNLSGYKQISRAVQIAKHTKKWAAEDSVKKVLLIYSAQSPLLYPAMCAKMKNQNVRTVLIVPDLPQYMTLDGKTSVFRTCVETLDRVLFDKLLKYMDAYVVLTKQMAAKLDDSKPFTVVEGIANDAGASAAEKNDDQAKIVLYTGTLTVKYGVLNLIDAMKYIKAPDLQLVIYGEGEGKNRILDAAKKDSRIQYRGLVTHSEAIALQKKASVLVNPRQNDEIYTEYSFPSKILEYLSSGTPVVAYKLGGIPDEYDRYITYVPDNSVTALAKALEDMCALPFKERQRMGASAREFVLREKNAVAQTKKIIDLVESL